MTGDNRWLTQEQSATWLALWSVQEWLPTRLDEQLKKDSGINLHDYFALAQISMAPESQLTMSELATVSDMSPSRLSHVVTRLEKRGFVHRFASPGDRRTNIAQITDEGNAFIQKAAPGHAEAALSLVFDALTEDETTTLRNIMEKILKRLDPLQLPRV